MLRLAVNSRACGLTFRCTRSATAGFAGMRTRVNSNVSFYIKHWSPPLKMDNYENPKPGKTYISPSLSAFGHLDRKVRIASKVIESPDAYAFAKVKDEMVLRHKDGAKSYIKATFFEDDRQITVLTIQGYTVATDKPHNASFSFIGEEIGKLLEFIANIQAVSFTGRGSVNITDEELRRLVLSNSQARNLVEETKSSLPRLSAHPLPRVMW